MGPLLKVQPPCLWARFLFLLSLKKTSAESKEESSKQVLKHTEAIEWEDRRGQGGGSHLDNVISRSILCLNVAMATIISGCEVRGYLSRHVD